ncbi:hypothetical protein DYB28_014169 [Aphanomyces astaci]|uniref:Uncharacterized protein n=1 Tax=Aphanomyces astaci TaxID=112090 RepID=A0A9X8ECY8_APHAT|nr:hypothetical protein DYB28_014169 [Aphanomyces astaci]
MDDTREALRLRQQDTTRARDQTSRAVQKPLTMNHAAVEALVAKKVAAESASIMPSKGAAAASTCRLAGHVLIRKKPSRGDPVLRSVLKIQAQFRRHHSRLELLLSLKAMTHRLHMAATQIQRIYRGHRAKAMVGQVQRSLWADQRFFHLNARRVQRWLRHRRLERVEAAKRQVAAAVVVPAELPAMPVGPSLTDVYREAGRKRRMERDRVTAEKRAQAALLIEKKHQGCHVIQGAFRHYNKRKTMRMLQLARRMSQESNAATHIQSFVRCTLAKKYARQLHARRELDTVHHSSTLIQATYRGHRVRQRMSLAATMAATKEVAGSPTKTRLPSVVLKPAVLKPHPTRPSRRRTAVTVPKPLQSPRDRLPSLVQQGRRKPGVSWEELKLKEPRIGDQL